MLLLSVPPPLVDETSNTPAEVIFSRVGGEEGAERVGVPTRREYSWAYPHMLILIMHMWAGMTMLVLRFSLVSCVASFPGHDWE